MLHSLALFTNRLCEEKKQPSIVMLRCSRNERTRVEHIQTLLPFYCIKKQIRSKCKINEAQTTNFSLLFEWKHFYAISIGFIRRKWKRCEFFRSFSSFCKLVVIFPFTCHHQLLDSFSKLMNFCTVTETEKQVSVDHFMDAKKPNAQLFFCMQKKTRSFRTYITWKFAAAAVSKNTSKMVMNGKDLMSKVLSK